MSPRKIASQQRSQATVEALLDATARILVREGYDRASTNRIAAVAGVSVGSLYQYFPNKESIVAALIARHTRAMLDLLKHAMSAVAALDLESAMRELIAAMVDAHRVDPDLHRILDEQIPRMGQLDEIEAINREVFALVRAYLDARRGEIAVADLDTATFICVTTVETLTHEAVLRHPDMIEPAGLVEEVTRLVVGYLRPVGVSAGEDIKSSPGGGGGPAKLVEGYSPHAPSFAETTPPSPLRGATSPSGGGMG